MIIVKSDQRLAAYAVTRLMPGLHWPLPSDEWGLARPHRPIEPMELKVWCDGIQRVVCGVSAQTTCQDVVFALAHATAQTGRFILIERWRNSERLLAPSEHPLAVLSKWGEYANDVTFVMKRSEHHHKTNANTALNQSQSPHHSATASPLPISSPPTGSLSSPNRRDLLNLINNHKSIYLSLNRKSGTLTQNSGKWSRNRFSSAINNQLSSIRFFLAIDGQTIDFNANNKSE